MKAKTKMREIRIERILMKLTVNIEFMADCLNFLRTSFTCELLPNRVIKREADKCYDNANNWYRRYKEIARRNKGTDYKDELFDIAVKKFCKEWEFFK